MRGTRVGSAGASAHLDISITDALDYQTHSDATVFVTRPENKPLSAHERHAELTISTDDGSIDITLNGEDLAILAGVLNDVQEYYEGEQ